MILPSGFSTTDYSQSANARGWGAGWQTCEAINAGRMKPVTLARSGAEIAGGMHATVAPLAEACFNAIEARGYLLHPGWCWGAECRQISGTNRASNHSWGLAADLNAPTNPYTSTGEHDIPDWAYDLLRSYGWGLGADYTGKKDYMHVEWMGTPSDAVTMLALAAKNGITNLQEFTPKIDTEDDEEMARMKLAVAVDSPTGALFAYSPGRFFHVSDPDHLKLGQKAGLFPDLAEVVQTDRVGLDRLRDMCVRGNLVDDNQDGIPSGIAHP